MKKRSAVVALDGGALVLLVSVIGLVMSMSAGQVVSPVMGASITVGIVLMGWGAFHAFTIQEHPGEQLAQALERIRQVRPS